VLAKKIGIDTGSSTMLIYVGGEGIVVNERSPKLELNEGTLRRLITRVHGRRRMFKPELTISVPADVSGAERLAMTAAAISAGARQAWLIDEPIAAAIGANLPVGAQRAQAVCDIGAAGTRVAVISLSGMLLSESVPVGGDRLDGAIAGHIKRRHRLVIDEGTAERAKIEAGSALPVNEALVARVRGDDLDSGRPRELEIGSDELCEAVQGPLSEIAAAICGVLLQAPAELMADIRERGLVLSGGGSLLRGIELYLSMRCGVPVMVADEPQTCVARGAGLALEQFEVLKRNQLYLR
jgi:rod shape-determining protein MreB